MKATIRGIHDMNFDVDKSKIDGVKLYYTNKNTNVVGEECNSKFIQRDVYVNLCKRGTIPTVGDVWEFDFNNKGTLMDLTLHSRPQLADQAMAGQQSVGTGAVIAPSPVPTTPIVDQPAHLYDQVPAPSY